VRRAGALDLPVAARWFVRDRVDDTVTLVSEPHVHRLLRCNVWHVRGRDRDLVVDTALGLAPHRADAAALEGAAETTLDATGFGEAVLGPYRAAGYDIPELLVDAVPPGRTAGAAVTVAPAPATRVLDDGDVVDLGDRAFEVLHLPGHSPGSIGLWDAASGVLFSGDAVYDGPLLDELDGSDPAAYVATMARLRELPVTVVHGGHEASFGRERLVEICDAYLARRG
jgi:glyoxylase-like metal-dependent hydrolase (beta-lactamase superfamily II)